MWIFGRKGASGFSASSTAEEVTQDIDASGLTAIITGDLQWRWLGSGLGRGGRGNGLKCLGLRGGNGAEAGLGLAMSAARGLREEE
ncbi:hypothetical protein RD792_004047 [Penstemon davidsonii]|uniref:Uncharacterized protein n=1 Tax=Penstemon davidsonii TaxID=160366 RepID=A0ABR0DGC8_9LAMI|nr:hypothetical protein RD792_004039 [Penstemon davidsonii]KAK4488291.1 hypothetical protein RD792_004047 [Penstemon davidsonii]